MRKSTKAQKNVCEIWQLLFYALMKAVTAQRSIHSVPEASIFVHEPSLTIYIHKISVTTYVAVL